MDADPKDLKVSIIVPTYCEATNIEILVARVRDVLQNTLWQWEIVFVDDDSQDGSTEIFEKLLNLDDMGWEGRVRLIRRVGRRGLASACIEGMASSEADVFIVMDADLQHDEKILPMMLGIFADDSSVELVCGTRYGLGGGVAGWSQFRHFGSRCATQLAKSLLGVSLSDPMSGFFALRSALYQEVAPRLGGEGFKILLDIFLSAKRSVVTREVPYVFRPREHGTSKLGVAVVWNYLKMLVRARALLGKII